MDPTLRNGGMKGVLEQMEKPAPKSIIDGLCHRLKLIEMAEGKDGEMLANECRSFISSNSKWVDVMMASYLINGGIILRDVPVTTTSSSLDSPSLGSPNITSSTQQSAANTPPMAQGKEKKDSITDLDFQEIESMVASLGLKV